MEGLIENPTGTQDSATFLDTVVGYIEDEGIAPALANSFDMDAYSLYERISMTLDTLQDIVDNKLSSRFGNIYNTDYKVVRWLNIETAVIGNEQIALIR